MSFEDLHPTVRLKIVRGEQPEDCWDWVGYVTSAGYGSVNLRYKKRQVHRYVYEELVGPVPEGLQLDHLCRNRKCCNPTHLEPVTLQENLARGEGNKWRELITACPSGHPYTEENTYLHKGHRMCRTCRRNRNYQVFLSKRRA